MNQLDYKLAVRNSDERPVDDALGRRLRDLRISVTDRCNFRCVYCMPKELFGANHAFVDRKELLSFEEIERVVRQFARLGVKKVRVTGGEPLVRRDIERLIESLAAIPELGDLALTTNGSLLTRERARQLKDAGLNRVTVSLDAISNEIFQAINDVKFPVEKVLEAIEIAAEQGLNPVKVNMVVQHGLNENEILPMVEHFRGSGVILRFIEFMDVGTRNGWQLDHVMPAEEIARIIDSSHKLESVTENYHGEVARRWIYRDGSGEIGIISSVSQPFCGSCSRMRLSAEGQLYTCLFANQGFDLRQHLRSGAGNDRIVAAIREVWQRRGDRYSEIRSEHTAGRPKIEMSYIGG